MLRPILSCCAFLLLLACADTDATSETSAPTPPPATTTAVPNKPNLPSVPLDTLRMLYNESNYIDYLFFELPVSMSQNTQADVQGALSYISAETPVRPAGCQPIGQIFYEVRGNTRLRANLYFSPGCVYLEFLDGEQPKYANKLMPGGIEFFNNLLRQLGKPTVPTN